MRKKIFQVSSDMRKSMIWNKDCAEYMSMYASVLSYVCMQSTGVTVDADERELGYPFKSFLSASHVFDLDQNEDLMEITIFIKNVYLSRIEVMCPADSTGIPVMSLMIDPGPWGSVFTSIHWRFISKSGIFNLFQQNPNIPWRIT